MINFTGPLHIIVKTAKYLFLAMFFLVILTAAILKYGVSLSQVGFGAVQFSSVDVKWNQRIDIEVDSLIINDDAFNTDASLDFPSLKNSLRRLAPFQQLLSSFVIKSIKGAGYTGHFLYTTENQEAMLHLVSPRLDADVSLSLLEEAVQLDIQNLRLHELNSTVFGTILVNVHTSRYSGELSATLADSVFVRLDLEGDHQGISFSGSESRQISTITPFVDLFGLPPSIQDWITTYLQGERFILQSIDGTILWSDPATILENLQASVRIIDCQYTFDQNLEPIESQYTDVHFKKGVLTILPHNASYGGQEIGGKSWLDIDFNDHEDIILTVRINTDGVLDETILRLLENYSISLPFIQTEGVTAAELVLTVHLNSSSTTADGRFSLARGKVLYQGREFSIRDLDVSVENDSVTIISLDISLPERFNASVTGTINQESGTNLLIEMKRLIGLTETSTFILDTTKENPLITYRSMGGKSSVDVGSHRWLAQGKQIEIQPFSAAVDLENRRIGLSKVMLAVDELLTATISGDISFESQEADIEGTLTSLSTEGLQLLKPVGIKLGIQPGNTLVSSRAKSSWQLGQQQLLIHPTTLSLTDSNVSIDPTTLEVGELLSAMVSGQVDRSKRSAKLLVEQLNSSVDDTIITFPEQFGVNVAYGDEAFSLDIPSLALSISHDENNRWQVVFNDLTALHPLSEMAAHFLPGGGRLTLSATETTGDILFNGFLPQEEELFFEAGQPVTMLNVFGSLRNGEFEATINESTTIRYTDSLNISLEGVGVQLPVLLDLLKNNPQSDENGSQPAESDMVIRVRATDTSLLFNDQRAIHADRLDLTINGDVVNGTLLLPQGEILYQSRGESFYLEGSDLGEDFFRSFAKYAKTRGGTFHLVAEGKFDDFSAIFTGENFLIRDFAPLNNTLALLDTVPALLNFSVPNYNRRGMEVDSLLIGTRIRGGDITVESFTLESPVTTLNGAGWVNLADETLDLEMNMITRAQKNLRKIPLLGYVLVGGEERPSIHLRISGDINDPLVENDVYRRVVTSSFSILGRTLNLPRHMLDAMQADPTGSNDQ